MNEIYKFIIEAAGVSTVLIFLGKFTLNFLRDVGLEKYKNELAKESIRFKSDLDINIEKFKISYSNVFVEKVEVIKETYKKLIRAENPLEYLMRPIKVGPTKSNEEIAAEVVIKANELFDYFDENELLFNDKSIETFKLIRKKYLKVWNTYSKKKFLGENISGKLLVMLRAEMSEVYEKILQGEIQDLKKLLKSEFQKQLGMLEEELAVTRG